MMENKNSLRYNHRFPRRIERKLQIEGIETYKQYEVKQSEVLEKLEEILE